MGIVYEAEQISLNRNVALKVLPFAATMDPRHLQRFRNEAQAAACLHHPNIVPVHGVGCERGVHYYAMQLIEGQTLAQVIEASRERKRPESCHSERSEESTGPRECASRSLASLGMTDRETVPLALLSTKRDRAHFRHIATLIASAADALEYAHSMGVVHRDIKPGNLMLDNGGHLWITDFGLAKSLSRDVHDAALTLTGDLIGTLRYMSPEQALAKHGLVDHRTDIYSLGATLYELLTLKPAVTGDDKAEILKSIAWEEPTPLRKLDKSLPAELETITLKCLAKEPGERYATAGEVAEDLRRWLEDRAIKAKPAGWREKIVRWGRRHRAMAWAAVAVLAACVLALTISSILILREKHRADVRFHTARQAVDDMYSQVAEDWLEDAPALTEVQKEFLEKALHFYKTLGEEHSTDPEVAREIARAHMRIGKIQAKLGRVSDAEAAYRESIARWEAIVNEHGNDDTSLAGLGAVNYLLSQLFHGNLKFKEAEDFAKQAVEWRRELVAKQPKVRTHLMNLAKALNALGNVHHSQFRVPEARQALNECRQIAERLATNFPDYSAVHSDLGMVLSNLASLERRVREHASSQLDIAEIEKLVTRAIHHQHAAQSLGSRRVKDREFLGTHYGLLADLLQSSGRFAEMQNANEHSIAIVRKLIEDFPGVPQYREQLAKRLVNSTFSAEKHDNLTKAIGTLREALAISRVLVQKWPEPANHQEMLAQSGSILALRIVEVQKRKLPGERDQSQLIEAVYCAPKTGPPNAWR